jgi:hypothetical protein
MIIVVLNMRRVKNFLKIGLLVLLVCLETSFVSCQNMITKIELINNNPVEYTFYTPIDSLYARASKQLKITNMRLRDITKKNMLTNNISSLFSRPNSIFDFYLEPMYYLHKSKIYLKENGDSLDYLAGFYLHLESIDETHTKVKITTIEPRIIIGRELLPSPPNMVRKDKTMPVEPSTIEEYKILLDIGRLVGEKDMPPLNLPDKN